MELTMNRADPHGLDTTGRIGRILSLGLRRSELLALMLLLCTANGMLSTIVDGIRRDGIAYAVANTFEVSVIVWFGLYQATSYALSDDAVQVRWTDRALLAVVMVACFLPIGPASWALLTGVALYTIVVSAPQTYAARAGWIFFGISYCMFWSRRIFNLFSELWLSIDAALVSQITQTERVANLVVMPGGGGYLEIAAPCSSWANASLALLSWVIFPQMANVRWRPSNLLWCLVACGSVLAINVTRISLIGFFPPYYDVLHGPIGSTVVSWVTVVVVLTICYYGVGRGRFKAI